MKIKSLLPLFFLGIFLPQVLMASGPTAKIMTQPISSDFAELLGQIDNTFYSLFVSNPRKQELSVISYKDGVAKITKLDAQWIGNFMYYRTDVIGNHISVFYRSNTSKSRYVFLGPPNKIYKQDYDAVTFKPIGDAQLLFDNDKDKFNAQNHVDLSYSDDHSKTLVAIEGKLDEKKCLLFVFDNKGTLLYNKLFAYTGEEKDLKAHAFKISNDGNILISVTSIKTGFFVNNSARKPKNYYCYTINTKTGASNTLKVTSPTSNGEYLDGSVVQWLNNGDIVTASGYFKSKSGNAIEGFLISKYDATLKLIGTKNMAPDPSLVEQANAYDKADIIGFNYLKPDEIVPLEGGNFLLLNEYYREKSTNSRLDNESYQNNIFYYYYGLALRMNDKMDLIASSFLPKKQVGSYMMDIVCSYHTYHTGNDVYLLYNDDFIKGKDGQQLFSMLLPADGGKPVISKVIKTTDKLYTSVPEMVNGADGKIFTRVYDMKKMNSMGKQDLRLMMINLNQGGH